MIFYKRSFSKKIFFLLLLTFIAPAFSAEQEKTIVDQLTENGLINNYGTEITFDSPGSESATGADQIIFIHVKNNNGLVDEFVAKVFKRFDDFEAEKNSLEQTSSLVEEINKLHNSKNHPPLPFISEYRGGIAVELKNETGVPKEKGVTLLTLAKGSPLSKIYNTLPEMPDESIINMFTNMGQQMAGLDAIFCKKTLKNGGACQRFAHPDSNERNFLYDNKSNQLYWIDIATREDFEQLPLVRDLDFQHPIFEKTGILQCSYNCGYQFMLDLLLPLTFSADESESLEDQSSPVKKRLLAYKTFFQSYANQIGKSGLSELKSNVVKEYADNLKKVFQVENSLIKILQTEKLIKFEDYLIK
jgi:hypothetical protein